MKLTRMHLLYILAYKSSEKFLVNTIEHVSLIIMSYTAHVTDVHTRLKASSFS